MTTLSPPTQHTPVAPSDTVPMVLVVGGALVAPLNLLIVRSFSVYDALIGLALLFLVLDNRLRWPSPAYLGLAYLFLLTTLVSTFRATYAAEALTQSLQYAFVFFIQIPVVLSVVTTRRRAVTSILLLCLGSLGAIAWSYLTRPTQGAGRVLVFYSENPNRLGYPAAYLIPLLLALWAVTRYARMAVRVLTAVAVGLGLYLSVWAVSASGSRSSLLGAAVALLVFIVLRPGLGFARAAGRFVLLCAASGALGTALVVSGQLPSTLGERIERSLDTTDTSAQTHLVADRENLTEAGLVAFMESPLVGTGLDNFRYVAPRYDEDATPQLPHNLWLQLLVQVGAVGTAAFALYLLLWASQVGLAARRSHPLAAAPLWGLMSALAGVLTIFMFSPELLDRHYWLIVALGLALVHTTGARDASKGTTSR